MNILIIHNKYKHKGGEDSVVDSEVRLLESYGHRVSVYTKDNSDVTNNLSFAKHVIWSKKSYREVIRLIEEKNIDILHAHNTFPLISPSVHWAAHRRKVPTVQTLHNFRLICPQAMLLRESSICEECVGKFPINGVKNRCYRNSMPQTIAVAGMTFGNKLLSTWTRKIDTYIALNEFCKNKFIEGGIPREKIKIKSNFVEDHNQSIKFEELKRDKFLYVGRLSNEKGISTLDELLKLNPNIELNVVGDGPLAPLLKTNPNAHMLGFLGPEQVYQAMRSAVALIVPSIWYENFPRIIVEAFSNGLPVICSDLGALPHIIEDGHNGLLFKAGDPRALNERITWLLQSPQAQKKMSAQARQTFLEKYTPEANYQVLMDIYQQAIRKKQAS